jgi:hypothetical protein
LVNFFCEMYLHFSGLDLLVYEPQSNALRLVESKKFNVTWYLYTHESRLLLLASGMQCTLFTGYQVMHYERQHIPFKKSLIKIFS